MGRRKLNKTPEQIAEQKRRWAQTRNAKRRRRYALDSAYRAGVHEQNRTGYRQRAGSEPRNCRMNIARLREFGTDREVSIGGASRRMLTFSVAELATALGGYHTTVLYRWQMQSRFPRPRLRASDRKVYTFDQASNILRVMAAHQDEKLYLQETDAGTIQRLFDAMQTNET